MHCWGHSSVCWNWRYSTQPASGGWDAELDRPNCAAAAFHTPSVWSILLAVNPSSMFTLQFRPASPAWMLFRNVWLRVKASDLLWINRQSWCNTRPGHYSQNIEFIFHWSFCHSGAVLRQKGVWRSCVRHSSYFNHPRAAFLWQCNKINLNRVDSTLLTNHGSNYFNYFMQTFARCLV